MLTNWDSIFNSSSYDDVRNFANSSMSSRDFSALCSEARRLVRTVGADKARQRARQALKRRKVSLSMA